jgi:hypothetical protein
MMLLNQKIAQTIVILFFLNATTAQAQHFCRGPVLTTERSDNPEAAFNDYVRQYVADGRHLNTDLKTIPTVVHILYDATTDSLPMARVQSQINAMNLDFRRLNPDTIKTRSPFKPVAADCQIEFCLASIDPQGQPTTGILWHQVPNFSMDQLASLMEQTQWPPLRYLNIWVTPEGEGGASSFAWEAGSSTDGFWVGAKQFGTFGHNLKGGFDEGGTGTHEAGHYLGLYHTFHDGFVYLGQCFPPCDSTGDHVCDTPLDWMLAFSTEQCEDGQRFCDNGEAFFTMSENYMAYAYDTCTNVFSQGQRIRMRAALDSLRAELCSPANLAATGCQAPSNGEEPAPNVQPLVVFPNPAREMVYLQLPLASGSRVHLWNGQGQLVKSQTVLPGVTDLQMPVSGLPAGLYWLEWRHNAARRVEKLVIQP